MKQTLKCMTFFLQKLEGVYFSWTSLEYYFQMLLIKGYKPCKLFYRFVSKVNKDILESLGGNQFISQIA